VNDGPCLEDGKGPSQPAMPDGQLGPPEQASSACDPAAETQRIETCNGHDVPSSGVTGRLCVSQPDASALLPHPLRL
jgi:hypothetical protein